MKKQAFSTMMASAVIFGSSMVGCSGAGLDKRPALNAAQAPALGGRVEKALADRDYARALMQAEELVAAVPNDPGYRALLGRAYLANGRYASARTAFTDAMTLGNRDVRTIISLSLSETGLGNAPGARALLAGHISDLPAADYGLAMAMAGDPREGVRALMEAVAQPEATAQTRQNLAYALALAGGFAQARLIAGQDLSAKDAEARIGQWSQAALAGNDQSRVAALIGVSPRADDSGLPARLALAPGAEPVRTAALAGDIMAQARSDVARAAIVDVPLPAAEPAIEASVDQAVAAAPVESAAEPAVLAESKPTSPDTIAVAMSFEAGDKTDAPLIRASRDPMRAAVRASFQRSAPNSAQALIARTGMSRIAPLRSPAADAQASDWVVQLGAYDSASIAREKWQRIAKGRANLANFREIHSEVAMNGRQFHRLAVRGFDSKASAYALCQSLRASGQACFVRLDDTGATRTARGQAKSVPAVAAKAPAGAAPSMAAKRPAAAKPNPNEVALR